MCCARFSSLARRYQIVFANVASLLMSGQLYDLGVSEPRGTEEGEAWPLPYFDGSINTISTRGANYKHHVITCPPEFSDFPRAL